MVAHASNTGTWEVVDTEEKEFKVILGYIANSRLAWAKWALSQPHPMSPPEQHLFKKDLIVKRNFQALT